MNYTLYWRDGKRSVVKGRNVAEAMTLAGFGGGAVAALDVWVAGIDHAYFWNTDALPPAWSKVPAEGIGDRPAHTGTRRAR